jgi:LmbE family N-acetylglucosaminyl deacetylase
LSASRSIFVSPHPDDAVWSCGGELIRLVDAGERALILSVFDGIASIDRIDGWRRIATPAVRRRENAQALSAIRAEGHSLGLTDAALRTRSGAFVYATPESLLGPVDNEDRKLIETLSEIFATFFQAGDIVYVPQAGAGSHVDHRIVRTAAERLHLPGLRYYPDFPYAPADQIRHEQVKEEDLDRWIRIANLYRSQVLALFGGRARFSAALRSWARTGEAPAHLASTLFTLAARAAR